MPGRFLSDDTKKQMLNQRRRKRLVISTATRWSLILTVAVIILMNLFTHVIQIVRYSGNSMEPNLHHGQVLVLLKTQEVSEGDMVAFYYNNQVLVRRVVCTGGKQISIAEDGAVSVNGQPVQEDYLSEQSMGQCNITFPYFVKTGDVFVMGDNRVIAMDSRLQEIGTVPIERIIGRILLAI